MNALSKCAAVSTQNTQVSPSHHLITEAIASRLGYKGYAMLMLCKIVSACRSLSARGDKKACNKKTPIK